MNAELSWCDTVASIGRGDYRSAYRHVEHGASSAKQTQRERVLDFILTRLQSTNLKLASMPGVDWTFERMALAEHPRVFLVGIEKSFTVYSKSRRLIPEDRGARYNRSDLQDRTMPYGNGNIVYSRCPAASRRNGGSPRRALRSHRLVLTDTETYATAPTLDCGATREQRYEYVDRFGRRTAIWLDFCGSLCPSVINTIAAIHMMADANVNVPFAITILASRDAFHADDERVRHISAAQSRLDVVDSWKYVGHGGAPMLTVCGILRAERETH